MGGLRPPLLKARTPMLCIGYGYDVSWADEGSASAERDPSPVTNALCASVPPSPTRGEGKNQPTRPQHELDLPRSFDTPLPIDVVRDELARTLDHHNAAVLVAPP